MSMIANEWIPEIVREHLGGRQQKQVTAPCARATNVYMYVLFLKWSVQLNIRRRHAITRSTPRSFAAKKVGHFWTGSGDSKTRRRRGTAGKFTGGHTTESRNERGVHSFLRDANRYIKHASKVWQGVVFSRCSPCPVPEREKGPENVLLYV